jgi:uncharacterized protein YegL
MSARRNPLYLLINAGNDGPGDINWVRESLDSARAFVRTDIKALEHLSMEVISFGESAELALPFNDADFMDFRIISPSNCANIEAALIMLAERHEVRRRDTEIARICDNASCVVMVIGNPPSGDYSETFLRLKERRYASKFAVLNCQIASEFRCLLMECGFKVIDSWSMTSGSTDILAKLFCVHANSPRNYLFSEGVYQQGWDVDGLLNSADGHDGYLRHLKGVLVEHDSRQPPGVVVQQGSKLHVQESNNDRSNFYRVGLLLACFVLLALGLLLVFGFLN